MPTLENRLQRIEDRFELHDLLNAYCGAVDSLSDMNALLACFTEDAVMDLGGIDLPRFDGHEGIRGFFEQVFNDMTHHAHFATNFAIEKQEGDTARTRAYVMGMGVSKDGTEILVYVKYWLDCVRTPLGWKIAKFGEAAVMPLPPEVTGVHGRD